MVFYVLAKYIANLFRVAVDGMKEERKAEAEDSSGEECREDCHLLPADLDPRVHKEADCEHNECN